MNCLHFYPDELVAARGGACGIPVCTECQYYEHCMAGWFQSEGVKTIHALAEEQKRQLAETD